MKKLREVTKEIFIGFLFSYDSNQGLVSVVARSPDGRIGFALLYFICNLLKFLFYAS